MPAELAGQRLDQAAALLLPEFSRSRLKTWIDAGRLTVGGRGARKRPHAAQGRRGARARHRARSGRCAVEPEAIPLDRRPRGRGAARDRQAGRPRRSSGRRQPVRHVTERAAESAPRARERCRARASCTGSTRTRADCCSSRARSRARRRSRRRSSGGASSARIEAICQGVLTGGGSSRRADRAPSRERTRMAVVDGGREARTHYRVLERFRAHTHCEVELETGRTHQIRVHMAHIHAPLRRRPGLRRPPALAAARRATSCGSRCRASAVRRCTRVRLALRASRRPARRCALRAPSAAGFASAARRCCARTRGSAMSAPARLRSRLAGARARARVGHRRAGGASAGSLRGAESRDPRRRRAGPRRRESRTPARRRSRCRPSPRGSSRCTARPCSISTATP